MIGSIIKAHHLVEVTRNLEVIELWSNNEYGEGDHSYLAVDQNGDLYVIFKSSEGNWSINNAIMYDEDYYKPGVLED